MSFEEYMESKIPGYKEIVPEARIIQLKDAFDRKEAYDKEAKAYLSYTSSAGIDYSNKFEKAMSNHSRWAMILESYVDQTKEELGIGTEEKTGGLGK